MKFGLRAAQLELELQLPELLDSVPLGSAECARLRARSAEGKQMISAPSAPKFGA